MPEQSTRRPAPSPRGTNVPDAPRKDGEKPDSNAPQGWRVTPSPDGRGGSQPPNRTPPSRNRIPLLIICAVALVAMEMWFYSHNYTNQRVTVPYSPVFVTQLKDGNVESITSTGLSVKGTFKKTVTVTTTSGSSSASEFSVQIPTFADEAQLRSLLTQQNVTWTAKNPDASSSVLWNVLFFFGPTILIILGLVWMMRRAAGGGAGGMLSFGRSRAKRFDGAEIPVTFNDVAGIDEAKADLSEIVDFLRNPTKYTRLGAKIPRGVLLSGPPGTGKTLLARAVAGEAGVPFFHMSASEFVEMIVGVGASRVRDLFAQAKQSSPAIIFVDELDAIGRSRSSAGANFGGHDEREQTLNQILTEMDGFDAHTGVIVLGATNRPEILDQALLRPGRFDRRVIVQPPDRAGREAILKVHTRSVPLSPEVNLGQIAATTPGMVGADLANLVNEAALLAAKRNHSSVGQPDFTDALERIVLGAARSVMMTEDDRRRTAYHESGHAIVGMLTAGADPVRKVSIIPRGQALGVTFSSPDSDRFNMDQRHLMAQIKVMLGGRCAEEVVFGDMTTGAESDIQQLTRIARYMVGRWGMSTAIGPIAVLPSENQGMLLPGASETSNETQRLVDEEVRTIVEQSHREVIELLRANRAQLDSLATKLLEEETLDQDEAYAAAGLSLPPSPSDNPDGSLVLVSAHGRNGQAKQLPHDAEAHENGSAEAGATASEPSGTDANAHPQTNIDASDRGTSGPGHIY